MLIYCHQFTICSAKLINKFQTDMGFCSFFVFYAKVCNSFCNFVADI